MERTEYRIDIVVYNTYHHPHGDYDDCTYWEQEHDGSIDLSPYERRFDGERDAVAYAMLFTEEQAHWHLTHGNGPEHESVVCAVTELLYDSDFSEDEPAYQDVIFENIWHGDQQEVRSWLRLSDLFVPKDGTWSPWFITDSSQWQRSRLLDGEMQYEMYQIRHQNVDEAPWFYGGGVFKLSDYDHAEKDFAYEFFDVNPNDTSDAVLAKMIFDNCWADFDLESADTFEEALEMVKRMIGTH